MVVETTWCYYHFYMDLLVSGEVIDCDATKLWLVLQGTTTTTTKNNRK